MEGRKVINKRQEGFVLPLVLILLAILTALSLGMNRMAGMHVAQAVHDKELWQQEHVFHDAFQKLVLMMLGGQFKPAELHWENTIIPLNGKFVQFEDVWVSVQDRNGLYPLQPNERVLQNILAQYVDQSEAKKIAAKIADWLDIDDLERISGMEAAGYVASGASSLPRNAPMRSLDELMDVAGVTREMYWGEALVGKTGLRDFLVLTRRLPSFNVATAPARLLGAVLGMDEDTVGQIVQARERKDWQQVRDIVGSRFGEEIALVPGNDFTIVMRTDSGHQLRMGLRLTRTVLQPYEILSWYHPDYERY